jgi:hypothetical protein
MEFGSFDEQEYVSCAGYYMVFDMISLGAAFACAIGTYSDHLNMNACEPCFAGAT